ncbi:4Fe-4S binding protein [Solemya pervernicosa gill symbiont]|uniref:4Fe-4S binding protein n=1 Tax=Solemya pervernicosa gill symbiont TaxID=642797 RepID=UPI001F2F7ABD|nr:4Fe-4S binding protein [Solemya pervernicosa gill symbiont]
MSIGNEGVADALQAIPIHATPRRERSANVIEAFFYRHRERLVWLHGAMFLFFLAVILIPVWLPDAPENATPLSHFTTFANYAMWGLWFPLVFLSVIVTGRSWCGLLCPMGAASEWANKRDLQRAIPTWLRWEGTPIVSFLFITILGQTVGVRDHPEAIAEVFGGTMLLAIVIGYLYGRKKRAWCRHACPIGLLLGR